MFYSLNDYHDSDSHPKWAVDILKKQQLEKLNRSPAFDVQTSILEEFFVNNNCSQLVDIGCWLGVLGYKLYEKIKPKNLILIDALPIYLSLTKDLFTEKYKDSDIILGEMCIHSEPDKFEHYFRLDIENTINTSNLLPKKNQLRKKIVVGVPTATAVTPSEAAYIFKYYLKKDAALKIDLDTMDYFLIRAMLERGFCPSVINFENLVLIENGLNKFNNSLNLLKQFGYKVPEIQIPSNQYAMYDFFTSKTDWKIMGYVATDNNDGVMFKKVIDSSNLDSLTNPNF